MANVAAVTPLFAGAACAVTSCTGGVACYVTYTTAQSALDMSKLVLVFATVGSTASVITRVIGENYSEVGQGIGATVTVGTSTSATGVLIMGGTSFESARFLNSDGYFSFNPSVTLNVQAILLP
jgi:hypothetical protein